MFVTTNTPEANKLRQQFEYFRGQVVTSFAHCEYFIGKFLYAIQDSEKFDGKFEIGVSGRVENFRKVFEGNSNLSVYQEFAFVLIDNFEKVIDSRHDFAHGLASLDVNNREVTIIRIKNTPKEGCPLIEQATPYKLDNLEEKVQTFEKICRDIIALILTIDSQFKLGINPSGSSETNVWVAS